jgi:hypothetical protein
MSATQLRETCVSLGAGDGVHFTNGYLAFGGTSLVRVAPEVDGTPGNIGPVEFSNVYLDGVNNSTGTPWALDIPTYTTTGIVGFLRFTGCFLGNCSAGLVRVRGHVTTLAFVGSNLSRANVATDIDGVSASTVVLFSGSTIRRLANGIRVNSARQVIVNGCSFTDISNGAGMGSGHVAAIELAGTIGIAALTGNSVSGVATDFSNTATIPRLVQSGNASAATTTNLSGISTGNRAITNPLVLDWYEEGTFTPTVTFGGGATGLTYDTQIGRFTRIGRLVHYHIRITLSNKGSSTGEFRIAGLPYGVQSTDITFPAPVSLNSVTSGFGQYNTVAEVLGSTGSAAIRVGTVISGMRTTSNNADYTNASTITLTGTYEVG